MTTKALLTALESAVPDGISNEFFDRRAMASDASHYLLTPSVIVRPTSANQMGDLFRISHEHGVGLTFRSGGTSLSGQGVSSGLLIDTRRNFREIEVLDAGAKVRVQPGATVKQVNIALAKYGRKLGPDPASEIACTIGGVVANNSSGMACGTEFNSYATLDSLTLILPSGTVINTSHSDADAQLKSKEPQLYEGLAKLRERVVNNPSSVAKITELYAIKNTMGYALNSLTDYQKPIDILAHLIVGSEGTLAFIAEVTFRTIPLLQKSATGLLIFNNLGDATSALPVLKSSNAAVIELLDTSSLRVAQREHMADSVLGGITFDRHAALLLEYQDSNSEGLSAQVAQAMNVLKDLPIPATTLSTDSAIRNELWYARKGLYAAVAGNRPSGTTAILEDIAVPMSGLHETTMQLAQLLEKHRYRESVIFGHAKDGNIHFLLNEEFDKPECIQRYQDFTEDMVSLVLGQRGSLKAEHGTGRIMAPYVRRQCGDELYEVMVLIKKLCDPTNLLNPGVMINENELVHIEDLKINPTVDPEVDRCVECGYCEPVCPSKNLTITPRQRIVIRRAMEDARASGDTKTLKDLTKRYEYDGIQTCAVDSMCSVACPVDIDTGALVKRLRAEEQSATAQALGVLSVNKWGPATSILGRVMNLTSAMPSALVVGANSLARKIAGNDNVPLWNKNLPRGGSVRKGVVNSNAEVIYFPSCVNSMFGASDGHVGVENAFLALCHRAGIEVAVPESISNLCCGTPWKSKGLSQGYETMIGKTSAALLESAAKTGVPVVCDATSCTDGLTELVSHDPKLSHIQVEDVLAFVADKILPKLQIARKIESIALHPTCSGVQLGLNKKMELIGQAVAHSVYIPENWACCGYAGDRGLLHPELTQSATQAEAQEITSQEFSAHASSNRPCEIGMSQATGETYIHLLEVLEEVTRG